MSRSAPTERPTRKFFRAAVIGLGMAALAARGQEPGVRHIVINELPGSSSADRFIELYNYGPDQGMNNWTLSYKTSANGASPVTYSFPAAFFLPRHALVQIHYAAGSNSPTDLYTGNNQPFSNASGEIALLNGAVGVDFIKFGSPLGTPIQPNDLPWLGPSITWSDPTNGIARQHDLNTRSAGDWYQPIPPNDGLTPGQLNSKQVGSRQYTPILVNEFSKASGAVELYNPNSFAITTTGMQIRGGQGVADAQCQLITLVSGSIAPGGFINQTLGGCTASWGGASQGSIRLWDPKNNEWDAITFNAAGGLTMTGANPHAARKSDIPTGSLYEWTVDNAALTPGALNPGQIGIGVAPNNLRYDELGTGAAPFALGANTGAGMQVDITRALNFREIRVHMNTAATAAEVAVYRLIGPNSWTRAAGPYALTLQAGDQVYTTGALATPPKFSSPDTLLVMVFANAAFSLQQCPPAERFSYGTVAGINSYTGYPSPVGPVAMNGLDATRAVQFFFWTAPGPAVQPESASLKPGEVNYGYNQQFNSPTGVPALAWSGANIPAGLSFSSATQSINGSPTAAGTFSTVQITSTDANAVTDVNTYILDIYNELQWVTLSPLPDGEANVPYNLPLSASGGPPGGYNWTVTTGPLPTGMTLGFTTGILGGTPNTPATNQPFTLHVTDLLGNGKDRAFTLTIQPQLVITTSSLPSTDSGSAYSALLTYTGGAPGPLNWTVISGTLPAAVTLAAATGQLSGPVSAVPGLYNFTVQAVDSLGGIASKSLSIQVNPALNMVTASLIDGEEHRAYSKSFTASGGNGAFSWSALSGLPGFCSFSAGGVLSCPDPTPPGPVGLTVRLTDTAGGQVDRLFNFQFVAPPSITTAALSDGEVNAAYSVAMAATGGITPYSWNSVSLPPGLTLSAAGVITGSPTGFGTFSNININLTDGVGGNAAKIFNNVVIHPQLLINTASLPGGDSGGVYSSTLNSTGGDPGGRSWTVISGSLPAGLTLDVPTGLLSGTITALSGPYSFTVRVADSFGSATRLFALQVYPALTNNTAALPDGEAGISYSQTLNAGGGNGPYTWSALSGLPAFCSFGTGSGLLSCANPTATSVSLTIRLTDTGGGKVDRTYNFQFAAAPSITTATLYTGEVNAAYNQTLSVSGGVAPFSWSASLLPPGLSLSPAGVISGMPTAAGTYNGITITVNDGPGGTAQRVFNGVAIVPTVRITTSPGPLGPSEVGIPFTATLAWADGQGPVTFTLDSGNLPPGITLAPGGAISGTPTSAGGFVPIIRITDALGGTESKVFNISVNIPPVIVNTSLPKGVVQVPYPPLNLLAQGGVPPYAYSVISGALPDGVTFDAGTGQFNGTPTQVQATFPIFKVTDSLGGNVTRLIGMQVIDPPLPTDWSRRAQFSGGVGQIVLTPGYSDSNAVAFVTADQGGELFRSVDRGFTWQSFLVDPSNSGAPIHTLRLTPDFSYSGATGVVFASTGVGGVYRSIDGGATFTARNAGLPNLLSPDGPQTTAIAVSPAYATDTTVWVVAQNGTQTQLFKSTAVPEDWGTSAIFTFASIAGATGVSQLEASPNLAVDNTLFAVYNGDVYRSTTRGTAWSNVFTDPSPGRKILHITLSPGYAVTPVLCAEDDTRLLFCSKDAGSTWGTLGPHGYNITFGRGPSGNALFFKDIGGDYALVMSEDLSDTFVPIYARGMRPSSPVFASALAVGAVTGDIYSGTSAGLTVSTDNGNIFFPRQAGLATIKAASVSGADNFIIAATDGGFLRSRDGGLGFVQIQNLKQADGSVIQLPNLSLAAVSPAFANDKTFFLNVTPNFANTAGFTETPVNPGLYRTTDGGFTFTSVLQQQCRTMVFAPGFDSRPGQPVRTLYVGCFSGLYRSNDGGVNFVPLSTFSGMDPRCNQSGQTETDGLGLSPRSTGGYTLFRSGSGGICVSTDSGNTWSIMLGGGGAPYIGTISSPSSTNANSNTPADRLKLRIDFIVHGIFYSTDEIGTNWTVVRRDAVSPLAGIVYARAFFSPNYATDRLALIAVNRSFNGGTGNAQGGLYRFDANTGIATPLAGADLLRGRVVTGIYMTPNFDGANNTGTALVTTQGGAVYRSTDGAHTFAPITRYDFAAPSIRGMGRADGGALGLADFGKKSSGAAAPTVSSGTLLAASDDGVYASDDAGLTFDDISQGLPDNLPVLSVTAPSGSPSTPVAGVSGQGLYKYDGSQWTHDATYNTGDYVNFTEDGSYLYAVRSNGTTLRGDLSGNNWTALDDGGNDLAGLSYSNESGFSGGPQAKTFGPYLPNGTTASLWAVSATTGPKFSSNSGSTWTASPGGNDYVVPSVSSYQVVTALGLDSVSSSRVALVGYNGGLYRTTDGGDTWRSVTISGSGLEATTKNATAMTSSTTTFGNTDVLVGISGTSSTGGVYLSGDAGEHWTQINSGFDSATLNITSLVKTSCTGCPVQYYSGTYGSGVYTRTVTVNNPPAIPGSNYACWGSTVCSCSTTAGSGPEEGGQGFKLCGTGFLSGAVVEFDGIAAAGCSVVSATVITCTGTPPHFAGSARVRVRNIDTRTGYLPSSYTYTTSSPRVGNTLTVAKSGSNAVLSWASCTGCDASHPARIYRSQSAGFTLYNEQYNTTSLNYTNTGAAATAYSYFWNVE